MNNSGKQTTAEDFGDSTIRSLDITQNTHLSELKFNSRDRVLQTISWLPEILMSAPSSLESIQITFAASKQFNLDFPSLFRIVSLLDDPKFENLRVVHFEIYNPRPDADLDQAIVHGRISVRSLKESNVKVPVHFMEWLSYVLKIRFTITRNNEDDAEADGYENDIRLLKDSKKVIRKVGRSDIDIFITRVHHPPAFA